MKNILTRLLLLLALSSIGCDPVDNRLVIVNESDKPLFFKYSLDGSMPEKSPYWEGFELDEIDDMVRPHSEKKMEIIANWETFIRDNFKDETFYLFVFDLDTLKKHPWPVVRATENYLHKYEIEVEALKEMNWRIIYDDQTPL